LRGQLTIAVGNLQRGVFQAAIASAQQVYARTSELRAELLRLEYEYDAHLDAAKLGADEALALCEAQALCTFVLETDEGPKQIAGRVDFWSGGGLTALRRSIEEERARLARADAPSAGRPHGATLEDLAASFRRSEEHRKECLAIVE